MHPTIHFIIPEGPLRGSRTVYRPVLPRGVLQIARAAEVAGWQVTVLDGYSAPHLLSAYFEVLAQRETSTTGEAALPDLVGISVHGPPAIDPALAIAKRLREIAPSLPLLFGGQLANADAELLLPLLPERSILFCGDGDAAIAEVAQEALKAVGGARLIRHPGLHPWQSLPDLDLLLPRYEAYFGEQDFEYHFETQIGCPYRCFHCGTGRKGLYATTINRPIEAIQAELDQVVTWAHNANLPYPRLWITDETFGSDPEHARVFCEILSSRPEPWRWRAQSRADAITEDLLGAMRTAGCERLAFGVEIPNNAGLDLLGKREAMKAIEEAFALCHGQGVSPEAIIVVGTPDDPTLPEDFLEALDLLGAASVQAYIYHPIPGSPWWKKYGVDFLQGAGPFRHWADLDFHSPPLGASPIDAERAIVAFLALQMWRPESERKGVVRPIPPHRDFECPRCGLTPPQSELVFAYGPIGLEIRRWTSHDKRYYVVTTPEQIEVLEIDPAYHRNLYSRFFSGDRQVSDLTLCPQCLLDEEGFTPENSGTGTSFLAI